MNKIWFVLLLGIISSCTESEDIIPPYYDTIHVVIYDTIPIIPSCMDIDGNVYKTTKIGDQIWMAENLKVTKFNDGTVIPNIIDGTVWSNLKTPAYSIIFDQFGNLYNWYAVSNDKLCPDGWRVSNNEDWIKLKDFVGMTDVGLETSIEWGGEGLVQKLMNPTGWNYTIGTNEYGFNVVASGFRSGLNGVYADIGMNACYWSSTEYGNTFAWFHSFAIWGIYKGTSYKTMGASVRCIKK